MCTTGGGVNWRARLTRFLQRVRAVLLVLALAEGEGWLSPLVGELAEVDRRVHPARIRLTNETAVA